MTNRPTVTRRFVATRTGRVHLAECGEGPPVLLLHQTPRSWDEYRDVLPLIGRTRRAIAMDTRGFGDSEPLPGDAASIEGWAEAALDLLDALEIPRAAVVGHHTGAVIALEIAASAPDRVEALVLSACPYVDAPRRAHHAGLRVIDDVTVRLDGAHLAELWARRQPVYPEGDTDLLTRFMIDALKAGPNAVEGHRAVNRYAMETRISLVACPTLVLSPLLDPHAAPVARRVAAAIPGSVLREIAGAMVPFPDGMPEVFAAAVTEFLDGV